MSMIGNYLPVSQATLDSLYANPASISDFLYEERSDDILDIDKAWHGIHFLLTGAVWGGTLPLANAVLGGTPIGEEDVGYGPARGLSATEVRQVAHALAGIDDAGFRQRFDPKALNEADIYPQIWDEGEEALDYLASYYAEVRSLFSNAAEAGDALLLFIN